MNRYSFFLIHYFLMYLGSMYLTIIFPHHCLKIHSIDYIIYNCRECVEIQAVVACLDSSLWWHYYNFQHNRLILYIQVPFFSTWKNGSGYTSHMKPYMKMAYLVWVIVLEHVLLGNFIQNCDNIACSVYVFRKHSTC